MAEAPTVGEVTVLLQRFRAGDSTAEDKLIPLIVKELRSLARKELRSLARKELRSERPGHTLQPTALVNEAYLRLVGDQARDWQSRAHFIGVSILVMKRILIDYARRKQCLKRGRAKPAAARETDEYSGLTYEQADELVALDMALGRLNEINPRQRQVVELRHFGGLSVEETGEVLNVSPIPVKPDWAAARAWLRGQVRPETFG
jgi:RNA polymerase sigma-70 factor, ECF subfamily